MKDLKDSRDALNQQKDSNHVVACYIGDNAKYWASLKNSLNNTVNKRVETINVSMNESIGNITKFVEEVEADIIYLDFSVKFGKPAKLAGIFNNSVKLRDSVVVGLVDSKGQSDRFDLLAAKRITELNYVISFDTADAAIQPSKLKFPDLVFDHKVAQAKTKKQIMVEAPITVFAINEDEIVFETDLDLSVELRYKLNVPFLESVLKDQSVDIIAKEPFSFSRGIKNRYRGKWVIKQEVEKIKGKFTKKDIILMQRQRKEIVYSTKRNLRRKIDFNLKFNGSKYIRVLEIDKFNARREEKRPSEGNYSFINVQKISDIKQELKDRMPHIITFEFEEESKSTGDSENESEIQEVTQDLEYLQQIVEVAKTLPTTPYIVVFGVSFLEADSLQRLLDYKCIKLYESKFNTSEVTNVANQVSNLYRDIKKKKEEKMRKKGRKKFPPEFRWTELGEEHSFGGIKLEAYMTIVSEFAIAFNVKESIPTRTTLKTISPFKTGITICQSAERLPVLSREYNTPHVALIHSIDELKKSSLRVFVNKAIETANQDLLKDEIRSVRKPRNFEELLEDATGEFNIHDLEVRGKEVEAEVKNNPDLVKNFDQEQSDDDFALKKESGKMKSAPSAKFGKVTIK